LSWSAWLRLACRWWGRSRCSSVRSSILTLRTTASTSLSLGSWAGGVVDFEAHTVGAESGSAKALVHRGCFCCATARWLGSRESEPRRKRPPQVGQIPVRLLALSWLTLPGAGWLPVPTQLPSGTPIGSAYRRVGQGPEWQALELLSTLPDDAGVDVVCRTLSCARGCQTQRPGVWEAILVAPGLLRREPLRAEWPHGGRYAA